MDCDQFARSNAVGGVGELGGVLDVTVVMTGSIIDMRIDGRCCLVNRLWENRGATLQLYAEDGPVTFSEIETTPLAQPGPATAPGRRA